MRYFVETLEDQLIATIEAASGVVGNVTVDVNTEVRPQLFTQPGYVDNLIPRLPFVYIQYQGKNSGDKDRDVIGQIYEHTLRFRFYCGAKSLKSKKDIQRDTWGAYALLRLVYDNIHGKQPTPAGLVSLVPSLSGTASTTVGFQPMTPFFEAGGNDEALVVNLPAILVYATDYTVRMMA